MKKILLFSTVLALSAIVYMGCQKEVSKDNSSNSIIEEFRSAPGGVPACNAAPAGFVTVTTTPTNPVAGQPVTVCVTVGCGGLNSLTLYKNGVEIGTQTKGAGAPPATLCYTFTPDAAGNCEDVKYTISVQYNTSGGATCTEFPDAPYCPASVDLLIAGICIEVTDECIYSGDEFEGTAVSCSTSREAIYTFGSENGEDYFKMQGGLTNFTGANATIYINGTMVNFNTTSEDDWLTGTVGGYTIGQRTPGGSSNRNIRVVGSLSECSGVTVRIVWNSTNSGGVITGDWSVKDENGVELAPEVAGLTCGG